MSTKQEDLFASTEPGMPPITLRLYGIEVPYEEKGQPRVLRGIPSFKTGKTAIGWFDKLKNRIQARPMTLPQHQKWMDLAILNIESQLRSALALTDEKIRTVASLRSWIASRVPLDDSWAWCPEILVKSELCAPGQEGATIVIERL